MKAKIYNFTGTVILLLLFITCNKKQEMSDLDKLRHSNNIKTYPVTKMDSVKAIELITTQKLQELLDLSTLYRSGNGDTEIDSVIYAQMQNYFAEPDSAKLYKLLRPIDSLKATNAKVSQLSVIKRITPSDTLNFAAFTVEYSGNDKKSSATANRTAEFSMKLNPVKFKKEFKFYFNDFDVKVPKDSTSYGVTR